MTGVVLTTALVLQRNGRATYPVDAYFAAFDRLAACGLPIVLYLDPALAGRSFPPQVTVVPQSLEDLPTWRGDARTRCRAAPHRNERKDTLDYLAIVNSKPGLVARDGRDASGGHASCLGRLRTLPRDPRRREPRIGDFDRFRSRRRNDRLVLPGYAAPVATTTGAVDWRFCGGFFHGSAGAIRRFALLHEQAFRALLPAVTWEVNLWARLEKQHALDCRWYAADHDDRILDFASARQADGH